MILFPTYFTHKVTDVDASLLKFLNVTGLILDIDDTLAAPKTQFPGKDIINWVDKIKNEGVKIVLLSNNFKSRVEKFAKLIEVPWVSMSFKPLTRGLHKAIQKISCAPKNTIMIGDQIFTDIFAANLFDIRSILVDPISENKSPLLSFKRILEKPIRQKIYSNSKLRLNNLKSSNLYSKYSVEEENS